MSSYSFAELHEGEQVVLAVAGEIDCAVAPQFVTAALRYIATAQSSELVLDLGAVSFIDSSGLAALVTIRATAQQVSKDVALRNVSPRVAQLLAITALDSLFPLPGDHTGIETLRSAPSPA